MLIVSCVNAAHSDLVRRPNERPACHAVRVACRAAADPNGRKGRRRRGERRNQSAEFDFRFFYLRL